MKTNQNPQTKPIVTLESDGKYSNPAIDKTVDVLRDLKKELKEELDRIIGKDKNPIKIVRELVGFKHNKIDKIFKKYEAKK